MPVQPVTRLTLSRLAENTRFQIHPEKSACWIWTGKVSVDRGVPISYYDGQDRSARQGAWQLMRGERALGDLRPDCGQHLCVNPHHMKVSAPRVMAE